MAAMAQLPFNDLLQAHRGIVFKVENAYCRHPDDRADLAQEIAAQLWSAWPTYGAPRRFSTWMYRIALNVAISFIRSDNRRRTRTIALDESLHDVPDDNAVDQETDQHLRLLQDFMDRQSPIDRALLLLYMEERSGREIADILGISETNVSTKIGRLKQRIRDEI